MKDGRRIAMVSDYEGLIKALRDRADELKVTRETIDAVSGLQTGYVAKLLAPVPIKTLGRVSLGPMLQALGVSLIMVEDLAALQRISRRLEKRARPVQNASGSMLTGKRKKRRRAFKGDKDWGKLMNAHRTLKVPGSERARIARKAARIRWRRRKKVRRDKNAATFSQDTPAVLCAS